MSGRRRAPATRSYGITPWSRAFAATVEAGADHRHLTGARRYFRDRHVAGLHIGPGRVTASVRGTQLDPFDVELTTRTVYARTVVDLLRRAGTTDALLAAARGEQPAALGELIAPTEPADVASSCTCPDGAPRCIHVLAVAFEVAAQIDNQPTTLLRVMGTDLPELLHLVRDGAPRDAGLAAPPETAAAELSPAELAAIYHGDHDTLPPLPSVPAGDPLATLDPAELRAALRTTGVPATALTPALDYLSDLYLALRQR